MSELEDKLNSLLSNQDAMAQVMQLAQSLSQSGAGATDGGSAAPPPPPQSGAAAGNAMPSAGDLNAMLSQLTGGLDPALLSRLLPVLSQMNRNESSETSALLYALQPFLRDKRRDKVARAAQLAKLIHLAKVFLTTREEEPCTIVICATIRAFTPASRRRSRADRRLRIASLPQGSRRGIRLLPRRTAADRRPTAARSARAFRFSTVFWKSSICRISTART